MGVGFKNLVTSTSFTYISFSFCYLCACLKKCYLLFFFINLCISIGSEINLTWLGLWSNRTHVTESFDRRVLLLSWSLVMYDTKFLLLLLWTESYRVITCFNYLFSRIEWFLYLWNLLLMCYACHSTVHTYIHTNFIQDVNKLIYRKNNIFQDVF